jgi:branched-chain amino acid transport system ATP-binding protein
VASAEHRPTVLQAHGLTKDFRGFIAVNKVDLSIHQGSIHALIGPNGAGKTTVFNLLTRFIAPSAGRIEFKGVDITREPAAAVARRGLVRSFQISATFGNLSVRENVRVALQRRAGLAEQFWRPDSVLARLDGRVEELLAEVNLGDYADTRAVNLSYGRKRSLEIATTLALEPHVLLLDEPMAGLAHEDIKRVVALIRRAAQGRTVLMVEHNLSVVRDLCDTITVLQRGEVIAQGGYDAVSSDPRVREAYMGQDDD